MLAEVGARLRCLSYALLPAMRELEGAAGSADAAWAIPVQPGLAVDAGKGEGCRDARGQKQRDVRESCERGKE